MLLCRVAREVTTAVRDSKYLIAGNLVKTYLSEAVAHADMSSVKVSRDLVS